MSQQRGPGAGKRQKFEEAGRRPWGKVAAVGAAVVVLVVGGVLLSSRLQSAKPAGGPVVKAGVQPVAGRQDMVQLASSKVVAGDLTLSLSEVTSNGIGGVAYQRNTPMPAGYVTEGNNLALLTYVAPSGRLVVATAMCEPCRSTVFHIEGTQLVCDTCFTRWDLNTLKGVSGGCTGYPPKEVPATVQGGSVLIPVAALEAWAPRG